MSIKDILVHVDNGAACPARLELAAGLAQKHGAHLIGLCILDQGHTPGPYNGMTYGDDGRAMAAYQAQKRDNALEAAASLERGFRERMRREDVEGEWRLVEGRVGDTLSLHVRYTDLAVLGQEDPDDPKMSGWTLVIEQALFTSGRPLLVIPYAGLFAQVGRRVLIGWNARREATRAVHDALPLIAGAEAVTVLAINPRGGLDGHGEQPAADISRHLARHGLPTTAAQTSSDELNVADILLNHAADLSADMMVIGGYGHSRMWEMVIGGVTRSLLQRMTVPVLMSH